MSEDNKQVSFHSGYVKFERNTVNDVTLDVVDFDMGVGTRIVLSGSAVEKLKEVVKNL